jgi:hypothetical protein
MYSPTLGRFMQTDPIGYEGGSPNLYAYVDADPVNLVDVLGLKAGDNFSSPMTGAKDATATYFRRNGHEWLGGLYRYTDSAGAIRYTYNAFEGGPHSGSATLAPTTTCGQYICTLIALWHTHNTYPYISPKDRLYADAMGIPYFMGYDGNTYLYHPKSAPNERAGNTYRVNEDGGWYQPSLAESIAYGWRERFGPGGTTDMIAYLLHCVVGEVDLCSEDESSVGPVLDPRAVSADGGGE